MLKRWLAVVGVVLVAAVVALPFLRDPERGPLDEAARAQASGEFVQLTHGRVHAEVAGPVDGPPVFLVHGFSVPSYIWDPTFVALREAGFRVHRFDLYGRGFSDRPDVVYDRDLFAEQLRELMDHYGVARANLVGISMGGAVLGRFAARHPGRVERLALIAPVTHARDVSPMQYPVVGEWLLRVYLLPKMAASQSSDFVLPENFPDWPARFGPQQTYDGFGRAILSTVRHVMTQSSLPDFEAIGRTETPVLLVWGRQDGVVPLAHSDDVRRAIPQAEFVPVDEAGHLPHMEQPAQVEAALTRFLSADGHPTPHNDERSGVRGTNATGSY